MNDQQTSFSRRRKGNLIAGSVLWILVFCGVYWIYANRKAESPERSEPEGTISTETLARTIPDPKSSDPEERPKPTHLPEFVLTDSDNQPFNSQALMGRPSVVAFIFTHCAGTCPAITTRMTRFQEQFAADELTLVSITVDPERDQPERLKNFAANFGADTSRWKFLTGTTDEIYQVVSTGFGMYYEELFGEKRLPGFEIVHTNRVVLIDADGKFVDTFLATNDEEMVRLRRAIRKLLGRESEAADDSEDGQTDDGDTQPATAPNASENSPSVRHRTTPAVDLASSAESARGQVFFSIQDQSVSEDGPQIDIRSGGAFEIEVGETTDRRISVYERQLPDFMFRNQKNEPYGLQQLLGKPFVTGFVFTRCAGPCPRVSASMARIQQRLAGMQAMEAVAWPIPGSGGFGELASSSIDVVDAVGWGRFPSFEGSRINMLTISVDPENDRPEVLARYARSLRADESRWQFLTGSKTDVYQLIYRGFGQWVQELSEANRDPGFEIIHTNNLVAVDAFGRIQGSFNALNETEVAALRRSLREGRPASETVLAQADGAGGDQPTGGLSAGRGEVHSEDQVGGSEPAAESTAASPADLSLPHWVTVLPSVNAGLNSLATVLLLAGYVLIRRGKRDVHRNVMLTAFGVSIAFLACYLVYHFALQHYTGESGRRFPGTGAVRVLYLSILFSHVLLAIAVPVLALKAIYRGLKSDWEGHRRVARIAFPVWLYVSVTGVIIYFMLYHWA